jgi:hypothetical protein
MEARITHLELDVDFGGDPVTGRIRPEEAAPRRFTGYAELISALEEIRAGEPPQVPIGGRDGRVA